MRDIADDRHPQPFQFRAPIQYRPRVERPRVLGAAHEGRARGFAEGGRAEGDGQATCLEPHVCEKVVEQLVVCAYLRRTERGSYKRVAA